MATDPWLAIGEPIAAPTPEAAAPLPANDPFAAVADPVAPPAGGGPRMWSKEQESAIVDFARTAKTPEEFSEFTRQLGKDNGVYISVEDAREALAYRDKTGNVSNLFAIPDFAAGQVEAEALPEDATIDADAPVDYGTASGLSPEQIRAEVEKLPENMRPGLTGLYASSAVAGLDNEMMAVGSVLGNLLMHPDEAIRSQGQTIVDAYNRGRTKALMLDDYVRLENPKASIAAEIGGTISNPIGMSARGAVQLAKVGAGYGAVAGFERGNGSFTERLTDSAKEAAIGVVAAPAIGGLIALPGAIRGATRTVLGGSPALARRIVSKGIEADGKTAGEVGSEMAAAQANDVPYMLADAGDNVRGTLAAAVRSPGPARTMARDALETRQTGLAGRVTTAIERDLGPVSNPHVVADTLMTKAQNESAPVYERLYSSPPIVSDAIDSLLARPSGQKALKNAYRIAEEEGVDPRTLGLVMGEDGRVILEAGPSVSFAETAKATAGRYQDVASADEYKTLAVRMVPTKNGKKVAMKGPLDITQAIRAMGGIRDDGGDLAHSGLTNAPRRMPFGANENFLGKLIDNESGMTLDDAAHDLWEAGYFPDLAERPLINDLIDRLKDEHIGAARYFHPDDLDEVAQFEAAQAQRYTLDAGAADGSKLADDASQPASFEDIVANTGPAVEGRKPMTRPSYSPQVLDYVKRGMDDVVEKYRDTTTGRLVLDTEGRAVNNTLRSYIATVDKLLPDYAEARALYAGPVRGIDAMNQGRESLNMTGDDLEARMRDMTPFEKDMFALGTRRAMAELVAAKGDSANVINAIVGTGKKRAMLARLFGDRKTFKRFVETLGQEKEGFNTFARSTLGSSTALNLQDDAALNAATLAADMMTTGVPIATAIRNAVKFGVGKVGAETRKQVAALLSETDPAAFQKLAADLRQESIRRGIKSRKIGRAADVGNRAALSYGNAYRPVAE